MKTIVATIIVPGEAESQEVRDNLAGMAEVQGWPLWLETREPTAEELADAREFGMDG